jgi:hypothetical protein
MNVAAEPAQERRLPPRIAALDRFGAVFLAMTAWGRYDSLDGDFRRHG